MKRMQFNRFNRDIYTYFNAEQEMSLDGFKKIMGRRYSRYIRIPVMNETNIPFNELIVDNIYDSVTSTLSIGVYEPTDGEDQDAKIVFDIDIRRLIDGSDEETLATLIGTFVDIIKWNLDGTCFIRG